MAGVFKGMVFPLGEVLTLLLKVGEVANSCPVEMEFAVCLASGPGGPTNSISSRSAPWSWARDAQDIPWIPWSRSRPCAPPAW